MATWNAYGLGVKLNLDLNLSFSLVDHLASPNFLPPDPCVMEKLTAQRIIVRIK